MNRGASLAPRLQSPVCPANWGRQRAAATSLISDDFRTDLSDSLTIFPVPCLLKASGGVHVAVATYLCTLSPLEAFSNMGREMPNGVSGGAYGAVQYARPSHKA
jgi:hypothetical protein